ncbi:hypothetical protein E4T44_11028 [Aureobasidium sp. EXF-8845]|nr:hypothetical protein E4T44_11028 [Aureobasidium sp. EXF-8845]KAI4844746.1 hypothetical protein E4T45_08011 [Aureobasidium sp. EXF-8846]
MNHDNDKPLNTKQKKKNKNKKKNKDSQNTQPIIRDSNQAQSSHLTTALPTRIMADTSRNEPGISERRGIRWLPNENNIEEPTSTLVLTSSQGQFVDIRIFCKPGETLPNEGNLLDWGIAGKSTSTVINGPSLEHPSNPPPPADGSSRSVCHSTFSHWIDSRTDTPGPDQGDMYPQPNNTTLELGAMFNPLTDSEQAYEEVWVDYSASAVEGSRWSIVVDLEDFEHKAKGRVVRVGEHCQAILKVDDQVTVERWKFEVPDKESKGDWKRVARLGDLFLPVSLAFKPESLIEGNTLTYGDYKWMVKEVYSW